jgi:hypothetical protein
LSAARPTKTGGGARLLPRHAHAAERGDGFGARIQRGLARIVGSQTAEREVSQALADQHERGRAAARELRRLRERIERNLSGLIGPLLARAIVNDRLQLTCPQGALTDTMRFIEERLEDSRTACRIGGGADALRRHHRQIPQELPLGVCARRKADRDLEPCDAEN